MHDYPPLHPGLADFPEIRWLAGLYVDKTPFLRRLLATSPGQPGTHTPPALRSTHQFLARPRRFGKSLLISTLEAWFQGLSPERSAQLPQSGQDTLDTPDGWTSPAWLWDGLDAETWHGVHGWHPVIRLNMSRVAAATPAGTAAALQDYLWETLGEWHRRGLAWNAGAPGTPTSASSPEGMLVHLIRDLTNTYGARPVVLVDEYDAPITEHMGTDADLAPAVSALRRFFRVLKDDEGLLYGVFVTGITRLVRPHLFSAANNFTDISNNINCGALCGFSEPEVVECLQPYRQALQSLNSGFDEAHMLAEWRDWYNGYRFAPHPSTEQVYNPFTLVYGLERTLDETDVLEAALRGEWPSAWSATAHSALTVRLAADVNQPRPDFAREGGIPSLPTPGLGSLIRPDFAQLMLDTGYYTWHASPGADAYPNFPNKEVAESWLRDILSLWSSTPRRDAHQMVDRLYACLNVGDIPGFARYLETFVSGLAGQNLLNEASFNAVLQTLLRLTGETAISEKSTRGGRADHEVTVGLHRYVFEVKYNRPPAAGLQQIRDRAYGREYRDDGFTNTAVALSFRNDGGKGARLEYAHMDLAILLDKGETPIETDARPGRDTTGYNGSSLL